MKIKTLFILLITFSIVQQGYAQKNNKVENVVLQLSINEKIDLLCAKFPGVQKQGLEEEIKQQGIEEEIQEKYCVVILHFASGKLDFGK